MAARAWSLLAVAALLSGCADFDDPERGNRVGIVGVDVAAPVVRAGTVTLEVLPTLDNLDARSGELNLTVKAFNLATGLLAATEEVPVGELAKDRSKVVPVRMTVPREAGYRLEVLLEQDGRFVQEATVQATNLMALEPTEHDTGLSVEQVDVEVESAADGRVRLRCPVYLTNEGMSASRGLRLQLKAREVSTGILADEQWADVDPIPADGTRAQTLRLEVPDDFNYELQAFLWDGEVIVERGAGKVQLLPTYVAPVGQKVEVSNPDISRFAADAGGAYAQPTPSYADSEDDGPTPGPLVPALAVALLAAVVLIRRRSA